MLTPSGVKIWRPRQLYLGAGERDYVEVNDRAEPADKTVFDAPVQVSHGGDSKRHRLATFKGETGEVYKPKL